MKLFATTLLLLVMAPRARAKDLDWIRVAKDKKGFVLENAKKSFVPWGVNYDHDRTGRLIEDYWDKEWKTVEEDFQEMKELGANVVRVHIQFGKFMNAADQPNKNALDQLGKLLELAEKTGLYLDLTGLGCYHKKDVPAWYDRLDEKARWNAQAAFWEAVAARCGTKSPAIFCYDLMNEPVVPGDQKRKDWLGGALGDKHFVQFITLSAAKRPRHEVARLWVNKLVAAVRKKDKRHLITVGLVPWSLNRPGLNSGFFPDKVCGKLDFIAVHIYPEKGKLDEAMKTLKGFADVGKPVVIEEIFPLKCSAKELGELIDKSKKHVSGWIGFYWGRTIKEHTPPKSIGDAIVLSWLKLFQEKGKEIRKKQ